MMKGTTDDMESALERAKDNADGQMEVAVQALIQAMSQSLKNLDEIIHKTKQMSFDWIEKRAQLDETTKTLGGQ